MPWCDDIYFWRQSLVLLADSLHGFAAGCILSFPAVLNPVILSPNATDIQVTSDEASWITSAYGFAGMAGFCFVPGVMQQYGRKITNILLNIFVMVGFIMLAFAKNVVTLYAARTIQGFSLCAVYMTSIILAEYSHPTRRGFFITFQKGSVALGSLICHASVLFCTWRQITAVPIIAGLLSILLTFLWPESPSYYAKKGRYEECDKSYIYLNGDTPKSRKELEDLISAQMEQRKLRGREEKMMYRLLKNCKILTRRDFLKPFFIMTLLTLIIDSCGRYYNLAYIVQIVKDITGVNSIGIYCSIGLDILTLIASWTSAYVITKFRRRSMLFIFGYFSVALMFSITLIVFMKSNTSTNGVWLTPSIILLNSFIVNFGVIPVCFTVSGEVYPLEYKGLGFTATGLVFTLLYGVTMKLTPLMMERTGIEGTYGIYGLCLLICLIILHFILTETKDRTLQEIEDEIRGIQRHKAPEQDRQSLAS